MKKQILLLVFLALLSSFIPLRNLHAENSAETINQAEYTIRNLFANARDVFAKEVGGDIDENGKYALLLEIYFQGFEEDLIVVKTAGGKLGWENLTKEEQEKHRGNIRAFIIRLTERFKDLAQATLTFISARENTGMVNLIGVIIPLEGTRAGKEINISWWLNCKNQEKEWCSIRNIIIDGVSMYDYAPVPVKNKD